MKTWRAKLLGAECKVMRLQDAPTPAQCRVADNPETIIAYLQSQLPGSIAYRPDTENMIVIYLTTRRWPITWQVISNGTLDTLLVHPREIFKGAMVLNAAAIVLAHNHPSSDPTPSEADIKVTRDLIRAGQLLKIDVLDHVIMGQPGPHNAKGWASLRELGYFYT